MKLLLVDNHTSRIPEWNLLLSQYHFEAVDIVRTENLKHESAESYGLVILTGATGLAVPRNMDVYKEEFELIRERTKPLLGVCVGFQAMAVAFGSTLEYRTESVKGLIDIDVVNDDPIFGGMKKFKGVVSHKYYVTEAPKGCPLLAKSIYNVEAFKVENKPVYGFQFHPEATEPQNDGAAIFDKFLKFVVQI